MHKRKLRVDELLVERGCYEDEDAAMRACLAGCVMSGTTRITTPGMRVDDGFPLEARGRKSYVSRGGLKLKGALDAFEYDPTGLSCIDLGASTGGFTDCLLQAGAAHVVALDDGYGQLAWSLQTDPRVSVRDRTDIHTVPLDTLGGPFGLVVADLSFMSIAPIARIVADILDEEGAFITLVKPQFESRKDLVGAHGIVTDPIIHGHALEKVVGALNGAGLGVVAATFSPLKGTRGNIEFFVFARKGISPATISVEQVVEAAHRALGARDADDERSCR